MERIGEVFVSLAMFVAKPLIGLGMDRGAAVVVGFLAVAWAAGKAIDYVSDSIQGKPGGKPDDKPEPPSKPEPKGKKDD